MRGKFVRWRGGRVVGSLCLRLLRELDGERMRPLTNVLRAVWSRDSRYVWSGVYVQYGVVRLDIWGDSER